MADARPRAASDSEFTRRALEHVRAQTMATGSSLVLLPNGDVQTTSAGMRVVHLHQEYSGIPIHDGAIAVHFDVDGRVEDVVGTLAAVPSHMSVTPQITAAAAVLAAARHVAAEVEERGIPIKVSNRQPVHLGRFPHPSRPTMLHKPPFRDPVTARLVLYGRDPRLTWEVHFRLPDAGGEWDVITAADRPNDPTVLHAWRTLAHVARGVIYEISPGEGPRTRVTFPCARDYHPRLGERALPAEHAIWVSDGQTRGNNVICLEENLKRSYAAVVADEDLVFEPSDDTGMDQRLLNAFFLTNFLHDFFFLLGFDEAAGNFQGRNFTGQGEDDDRLIVRVFNQEIPGIATMRSRRDGNSPELNLGPFGSRHTALDAEVIIHEYAHGVTNRTIGGRDSHDPLRRKEQSEAMGEGYSDYFAVSLANFRRRRAGRSESGVYAAWVSDNGTTGLKRRQAYGPAFTDTYETLRAAPMEAHHAGQVWCQALLRVNEVLGATDRDLGDDLGWQIVMDSLKLLPVSAEAPTFLHGRDAVLKAFDALSVTGGIPGDAPTLRTALVKTFTTLGMGPAAASPTARYRDIVADLGT